MASNTSQSRLDIYKNSATVLGMNYLLQVYNDSDEVIHREELYASTSVTADKIALNIVEREFVGLDWTLTEIV